MAEYTLKCVRETKSAARIAALLSQACDDLYQQRPGDDTTVAVTRVIERQIVNIFTGPPEKKADDERLMRDFMRMDGKKVVCGGTTSHIAAACLKRDMTNNDDGTKEVPPTSNIRGLDLVTEGVLTMSYAYKLLKRFDTGDIDGDFFEALDGGNGGARLARLLLEECTELNLFVGKANNQANYDENPMFDISIRKNLVIQLKATMESLGKQVTIQYY